jgi:4-carboxymuconolactone decarboxylase
MTDKRYDSGMATRRSVLGEAWVDRANANIDDFNRDFQRYITESCWNDVWNRPGIDRRTRSVIVLSITIALRHWDEFRLHLRGALNNGLSRDEIKEVLLQTAVYAGVPAANHAFKEARAFFAEIDGKT